MQNLFLTLDSLNVVSLTADHIDAGTIDANIVTIRSDLTAGAYVQIDGNGMIINNGTIDTFKADINGAVTMTSATIQSATGFPKVVMDPSGSLFAAYSSSDDVLTISPFGPVSTPSMRLYNSDSSTVPRGSIYINEISGTTYFTFFGQEAVQLTSPDTWVNGPLRVNAYADFSDGTTDLQAELDAKANGSGISGTVYVASTSGGPTTTAITFTNGVRTS